MSYYSPGSVLIVVQSLVGSGHLQRMAVLSRALTDLGITVDLVSGGRPEPLLDVSPARLFQLPPLVAANGDFTKLTDSFWRPITAGWQNRRQQLLLNLLGRIQPQVLVVEMFPFGRRKLRFELLSLLRASAQSIPKPVIICSVRDVLQQGRKPKHIKEMANTINRFFDYVFVHGDPFLHRFEETFSRTAEISHKLKYTGFITRHVSNVKPTDAPGKDEIIVSAGGGAVGGKLFEIALRIAKRSTFGAKRWRILVGNAVTEQTYMKLAKDAGEGVTVERARSDFYWLLKNCALSISQGGYNTLIEILQTGTKAVIIPFTGSGETEQTFRATRLTNLGRVEMVTEEQLSVFTLELAIEKALKQPIGQISLPDMRGATQSARLIQGLLTST
ncbi:glycosyltransferase family protein [Pseudomonadota bacterium]